MSDLNVSAATGVAQAASTTAAQNLTSDFNTFLTLLTAQVTNQDPLEPLDSTQFVEQLATFSGLEQQVASNTHLEAITQLLQNSIGNTSASLLGQQAATSAVTVTNGAFDALTIDANDATSGALVVRNAQDEVVFQSDVASNWSWDGRTNAGSAVTDGTYSFEIATASGTVPAFLTATIDRVLNTDGGIAVGFAEGVTTTNYQLDSQ